jgi:predicted permease
VADSLLQDIRYAIRTLRRSPLFAATVAVTMGLGLGLLASAFTILNAYLLKPIDLPNPQALYSLSWDSENARRHRFTLADYELLQPEASRVARLAAAKDVSTMRDDVPMLGLLVSGNYFELLGARPALGRLIRPDDAATRGAGGVVVLSHQAWRVRYGSDPRIVGRAIQLGRQRFEVAGVLAPGTYLSGQEAVSFYAPWTMAGAFSGIDLWSDRNAPTLTVVGRLRDGVTATSVRSWLDLWLRQRYPATSDAAPVALRVESLATRLPLTPETLTQLTLILSAFGLVMLVASANVTNLMLARALARQPEVAVRLALGASRWRVARQLIVESLVLAVPAAAAGLALTLVTARVFPAVIVATFPMSLPLDNILVPLDPDWRVLTFLGVATVLSAVLITLAPTGRLAGMRLAQVSRGEGFSDARGSRLRGGLVALQIGACALFLVAAVGLLDESWRLANPQLNLNYERVSAVRINSMARAAVAARLASDTAVEQVAVSWKPPMMNGRVPTTRMTAPATNVALNAGYTGVSPEYFGMFDIQLVRGRLFTADEAASGSAVALVSAATAAALWPQLDPIGQILDMTPVSGRRPDARLPRGRVRIIGVMEDVATGTNFEGIDRSLVYFPTTAHADAEMSLLVRARSDDPRPLRAALVSAVKDVAPEATFQEIPMRMLVGGAAWVFGAFSVTASILAVVGLLFAYSGTHAVVAFLVAQRRKEFGVRMALGASGALIVWGMLTETSRIAVVGLVVGLAVVAGLDRLFSSAVSIVPHFGPRPFLVGATIVLVSTAVAALVPLRDAARTDPAKALRAP